MKEIAGPIKLELAQYREMAILLNLDQILMQLHKNLWSKRIKINTELLKQNHSPLTVAEQVISVFAGVKGYLDDVELNKIRSFETGILEKIKNEKMKFLETIQSTGKLEKETEDSIIQIIEEYKKNEK